MGKPGKKTRKFAKKHLKAVIEKRHKYKHMRDASKRKQAAFSFQAELSKSLFKCIHLHCQSAIFFSGPKKGSLGNPRKEAENPFSKIELENIHDDEMMNADLLEDTSAEDEDSFIAGASSGSDCIPSEDDNDYTDVTIGEFEGSDSEDDKDRIDDALQGQNKTLQSEVDKQKKQLERLKEKDPAFLKFLKKHDKKLLQLNDEDNVDSGEGNESGGEGVTEPDQLEESNRKGLKPSSRKVVTTAIVDTWCQAIRDKQSMGAIHCILRVFRMACHFGDEDGAGPFSNSGIVTINALNQVMIFVLVEIDSLFRKLLGVSSSGGKRETIHELKISAQWRNFRYLVKSYLGNTLYMLNQMTDNHMISFTLQHLRSSVLFLAAFPAYLHKFLKVALHFWGSGEGALAVVSFLFIQEMIVQLGSDCLDSCFKGIYKTFIANCKFVNVANIQQIQFLQNCVVELYGLDLANAYPLVFVSIQRLGMVLRNALIMKTKEAFKKAYSWQYVNCLSLWVNFLCTHTDSDDLQPLAYPLAQIIIRVARLVPTARYFPLRLQCIKMLNRLASARQIFIPVASLLLDVLQFKEFDRPPTGEVVESLDFLTILKVSKPMLKTRTFQDACMCSVIEQLAEHLAQWSYNIAFPELAFVPIVHLHRFHKRTNVDRFQRQVKQLIEQVQRNVEYVQRKREDVYFSPNDQVSVSSFLQTEKVSGASPLSQYVAILHQKAEQRKANLHKSSVLVGEEKSTILVNDTSKDDYSDIKELATKDCQDENSNKDVASGRSTIPIKPRSNAAEAVEEDDVVEVFDFSSDEFNNQTNKEENYGYDDHPSNGQEHRNGNAKVKFKKAAKSCAKGRRLENIRSRERNME